MASSRNRLPYGAPEMVLSDGVEAGAAVFTRWAKHITAVAGADSATAIIEAASALDRQLELDDILGQLEDNALRGLMLGALDSDWEMEHGLVKRARFRATPLPFVRLPFIEARKAFEALQVVDIATWLNMQQEARSRAFTIAYAQRQSMIQVVYDELARQLAVGASLRGFRRALASRFETVGWTSSNPSHVELVYRNAVQRSYAAGRRQHALQPHVLMVRPYWQIITVNDGAPRQRKTHRAVHLLVLRATDAFWSRAPLPWGHNCRCRSVVRSEDWVRRSGVKISSGSEAVFQRLPDRGWVS